MARSRPLLKHHQDDVRAKIQSSLLIRRLTDCAMGEVDLSTTQIQAIKILLDKSVSNAPTVLAGDKDAPLTVELTARADASI